MKEREVRTENQKLKMFCMKYDENNNLILEIKNGKRTDYISYDTFCHIAEAFMTDSKTA